MRTFAAALLAGSAFAYNEAASVDASHKMTSLSTAVCSGVGVCTQYSATAANEDGEVALAVGDAVLNAVTELSGITDEIPGLGYLISIATGGDDSTAQILAAIEQLEYELNQMHNEMTHQLDEIMNYQELMYCANDLKGPEQDIYDAFFNFKEWLKSVNSNESAATQDTKKDRFLLDCDQNKCLEASRYLLNALAPKGSFPSLACNVLDTLYKHSGKEGYVGYRNEIARRAGNFLAEATVGVWMQTAYDISRDDNEQTPEEALNTAVGDFGEWTRQAAENIKDALNDSYNNWTETRGTNEGKAITIEAGASSDHQTVADGIHGTMRDIYPWRQWLVSVNDREDYVCRFDYRCDEASACMERHDFNNDYIVVANMDPAVPAIDEYLNWSRIDWCCNTGGEFCTAHVVDYFWDNGCDGGVIVTKPNNGMAVATNFNGAKFVQGKYEHVVFWGQHECTSMWGNGLPTYFLH